MQWVDALKEWNTSKGSNAWCIPKKGTKEHELVKAIMKGAPPAKKKVVVDDAKPLSGVVKKADKESKIQKAIVREDLGIQNIVEGKRIRKPKRFADE